MRMYFLELPTFSKKKEEDCTEKYQYWMYNLSHMRNMNNAQSIPFADKQPIFNKVFNIAEVANMTPEEARRYKISEKSYLDSRAVMETAVLEASEAALAKGREEGRAEGIEIGEMKGKKAMALRLLANGSPADFVAEMAGITIDELIDLVKDEKDLGASKQ